MTLTDGDVAALAREVVDRRDPDLDVRIEPADPVDPYRFGAAAWTVAAGGRTSYLHAGMTPEDARAKLVADLGPL
jgi:hypothetical protein